MAAAGPAAAFEPVEFGPGIKFESRVNFTYTLGQRIKDQDALLARTVGINDGNNNFAPRLTLRYFNFYPTGGSCPSDAYVQTTRCSVQMSEAEDLRRLDIENEYQRLNESTCRLHGEVEYQQTSWFQVTSSRVDGCAR